MTIVSSAGTTAGFVTIAPVLLEMDARAPSRTP